MERIRRKLDYRSWWEQQFFFDMWMAVRVIQFLYCKVEDGKTYYRENDSLNQKIEKKNATAKYYSPPQRAAGPHHPRGTRRPPAVCGPPAPRHHPRPPLSPGTVSQLWTTCRHPHCSSFSAQAHAATTYFVPRPLPWPRSLRSATTQPLPHAWNNCLASPRFRPVPWPLPASRFQNEAWDWHRPPSPPGPPTGHRRQTPSQYHNSSTNNTIHNSKITKSKNRTINTQQQNHHYLPSITSFIFHKIITATYTITSFIFINHNY